MRADALARRAPVDGHRCRTPVGAERDGRIGTFALTLGRDEVLLAQRRGVERPARTRRHRAGVRDRKTIDDVTADGGETRLLPDAGDERRAQVGGEWIEERVPGGQHRRGGGRQGLRRHDAAHVQQQRSGERHVTTILQDVVAARSTIVSEQLAQVVRDSGHPARAESLHAQLLQRRQQRRGRGIRRTHRGMDPRVVIARVQRQRVDPPAQAAKLLHRDRGRRRPLPRPARRLRIGRQRLLPVHVLRSSRRQGATGSGQDATHRVLALHRDPPRGRHVGGPALASDSGSSRPKQRW